MLAILVGCGLRRAELTNLPVEKIQARQGHWVIVDLGLARAVTFALYRFRAGPK